MLNIRISDKYRITQDRYQLILREICKVEDKESPNFGEERDRIVGYYKQVRYLVQEMIRLQMAESDCTTLLELQAFIEECCMKVESDVKDYLKTDTNYEANDGALTEEQVKSIPQPSSATGIADEDFEKSLV